MWTVIYTVENWSFKNNNAVEKLISTNNWSFKNNNASTFNSYWKKNPVYSENIFGKSDPDPKSTGFSNFFLGSFVLSV